jgi:hypothetical protein
MLGFSTLGTTALGAPTANEAYSLQVTTATFTLSMQGAAKLITDIYPSGSFATNGRAVGLSAGRPSTFTTGSFSLSGQNIDFDQNFGLIIDSVYNSATFTYTGQNVVFDTGFGMVLDSGSYSLTGQSFAFTKQMNISAETGVFTYTGQDALKGVGEVFAVGAFTYSGQAVDMTVQRHFDVDAGSYSYSFHDFKIRGWLTPITPPEIWTDAA